VDRDSKEFAIYTGGIVFLIIIIIFLWCIPAKSLAPEYAVSLTNELNWFILQKPKYVMSDTIKPDDPISMGVDCSRYLFLSARRAGIPVLRTTSLGMSRGQAGWLGKDIELDNAEALDVPFWTFKPDRPCGHVGMFIVSDKSKLLEVTHSSPSRGGIVLEQLKGKLLNDISKIRHLIIGDKK
jgi:hypothetical protein